MNDFDVVLNAIWEVHAKWQNLGLALGILPSDLEVVKKDSPGDAEECFRAVVRLWLTREDPRPTWAALVEALQLPMLQYGALAARIQAL